MHDGGWWSFISHDESKGKPNVDRNLLKRVFSYARPYWISVTMVLATIIVIALLDLVPPLLTRELIDNVLPNRDVNRLNLLAIGLIGIPLLSQLIGVAQRYFSSRAGEGIIYDMRQQLYEHIQRMSIRFFTNTKSGEIISRLNNDVVGAQNAITGTLPGIVTNIFTLITTLIIMLAMEWRLTLLSIVVLPLFLLPARRVGLILRKIRKEGMEYNADMSSIIQETLSINGSILMKIFGRQKRELTRFKENNAKVRDIGIRRALVGRWFFMGIGLSAAIGSALLYWAGGHLVLRGDITVGSLVAFSVYIFRLYGPISGLTNVQIEFIQSLVSFERVFEYLDLPVEIADRPGAEQLQTARGSIRFNDVSFSYLTQEEWERQQHLATLQGQASAIDAVSPHGLHVPGNGSSPGKKDDIVPLVATREWAVRHMNFEVQPGQLAALVGPSGAGKTTVTYLLPRLYDPTEGAILLDGRDLRDLTLDSLSAQMGMVTQETYLFHDTVRANLLYARPDATEDELVAACKAANIHDFISKLPDGYDTRVGERGYRLSGGEKQRIAIARVILKNPRILILDEATSHLDSQSEALIQSALEPLFKGRTSFVIAHRLSTILAADVILVIADGKVVEQGAHAELLAKGGLYADLFHTQFNVYNETG